ncbi:MAG: MBL fold metallo-hydrolase [Candidatus Eremiobacteraeota bacterium]|nr:MBL fold metallo-hydrolase [Candidatus Eremiobacteraeota bacterium]MBC5804388.1 MBL fold metallo-hydrolase [Candidatus Eremiobacteraeota bacterium]MBC5821141.1 MBL fold metallo-hydrolase [Candidatus Eremiobacteraeota bacterium]
MLEDDFSDVLRKAKRGVEIDDEALGNATGLAPARISDWTRGDGIPSDDEARALARVLRLDPGKFADAAAQRWHPDVALPEYVRHHPHDPHPSNGYLFFLQDGKTAALIDPAGLPQTLMNAIAEGPYALRYILITHKHEDHCDATADVARAFPDAQIVMHRADAFAIGPLAAKALPIVDGDELPFGDAASIRMLHTPGHTDGSSSFLFRSTLFTGDTLFAGSVGGAAGDRSTYGDILDSVRTKFFALDDATVVMPGHGPPSTIGEERAHNPFFTSR